MQADNIRQQLMAEEEQAVAQAAARKAKKSRQKVKKQQQQQAQQAATQQLAQFALSSQQAPATSSSEGTAGPLFQDSLQGDRALSADVQAASQAEASASDADGSERLTSVPAVPGVAWSTDNSTCVKLQGSSARAAAASHASCLTPSAAAVWSMDVNKTGLKSTVHATPVHHLLSCPVTKVR